MLSLENIKNKKLRSFLENYDHFTSLSEEAQQDYLKKMTDLSNEKQQEVFEFLDLENQKAKLEALDAFYQKVEELGNKIVEIAQKKKEQSAEENDAKKLDEILNQINN